MPKLIIHRPSAFRDFFRPYRILINGVEIGKIKTRESLEIEVPSGRHSIMAKIDWGSSAPFEVDIVEDGTELEIVSDWSIWDMRQIISKISFERNEYLKIQKGRGRERTGKGTFPTNQLTRPTNHSSGRCPPGNAAES